MTTPDLDTLSVQWTSHEVAPERLLAQFRRYRRAMRVNAASGLLALAVLAVALLYSLDRALRSGLPEQWIVVGAFALAVPPAIYCTMVMLRRADAGADLSSRGVLALERQRLRMLRATLASARLCTAILILASLAVLLLGGPGKLDMARILLPVSAWIATAILVWAWQRGRSRSLARQQANVDRLLAEFGEADEPLDAPAEH